MRFYNFNIGDYSSATQHLEPMEDLAYRRMLDLYYQKEIPLPLDPKEIARLVRMRTQCECIESVLREFFTKGKDGWHNKGADRVLSKVYEKSEAAKRSAEARWNKNKNLAECERNANASETQCENESNAMLHNTHNTIPNTKDVGTTPSKLEVPLQQVLDAYHELLPMMAAVQIYSDKRKTLVRNFWRKRSAESKARGKDYSIDNLRGYLAYIAENCQWMLEDRPNGKGGFWKAKNFDYIFKDDCYIAVKEQRHDNRN